MKPEANLERQVIHDLLAIFVNSCDRLAGGEIQGLDIVDVQVFSDEGVDNVTDSCVFFHFSSLRRRGEKWNLIVCVEDSDVESCGARESWRS